MNHSDSLALLMNHAGLVDGPRLEDGIVGMLRPFQGIVERNLHEVVDALFHSHVALAGEMIHKDLPRSVLIILSNLKTWAIRPDGALQRNRLLDESGLKRLEQWHDIVESATLGYMASQTHAYALYHYMYYVCQHDVAAELSQAAIIAAVEDSLSQHEDYKLAAVNICLKYPAIGTRFRGQVAALLSSAESGELQTALTRFLRPDK